MANALPLTYAVEALQHVQTSTELTAGLWADLGIVAGAAVVATVLGAATLRRRTG